MRRSAPLGSYTLALLLTCSLGLAALTPAVAAGGGPADEPVPDDTAPPGVLIVAVPGMLWSDLGTGATPTMDDFVADSAVAGLATRVVVRVTRPGEAYATIGAGTRAVAPGDSASLALGADEPYGTGTADSEYARRTGNQLTGDIGLLGLPALQRANDAARFGAQVGLLGDELQDAGRSVAVIANADEPSTSFTRREASTATSSVSPRRDAATALMGTTGVVPAGRVDTGLRRDDSGAPFGWRLDPEQVWEAFDEAWEQPAPVVLVEASDLMLAHNAGRQSTLAGRTVLEQRALAWTDELLAGLLERVDADRDRVMLVAPTPRGAPSLTVLAVSSPDLPAGLLDSSQTRTPGLVTMADVGPTILDLAGVAQPAGIEGRPARVATTGGTSEQRIAQVRDLNSRAQARDALVGSVTQATVVAAMAVAVALAAAIATGRGRRAARVGALWLAAAIICTFLAAPLGLPDGSFVVFVGAVAALAGVVVMACVALARLPAVRRGLDPLAAATALSVLALATATTSVVLLDSAWQQSTIFGDSPIVAGRFTGVNNLTFAMLTVAALLVAAVVVRDGRRRGRPAARGRLVLAAAVLVGTIAVIGMPMWGADVGGVLAAVPAFAIAGLALAGRTPRWGAVIGWTVAAFAAVTALGFLDLTRAPERRSHLGRLFERIGDDGFTGLQLVVERKLEQNLRTITGQPWTWLLVAAALLVAYLVWRHRDRLLAPWRTEPEMVAAGQGVAVALVLGFGLNDSGVAVPGMMILWLLAPLAAVYTTTSAAAAAAPDPDAAGLVQDEANAATATSGTLVTTPSTPS